MFKDALIGSLQINSKVLELGPDTDIDLWQQGGELSHGLFIIQPRTL